MSERKVRSEMKVKIENEMASIRSDSSLAADHKEAILDMLVPAHIAVNGAEDKIEAIAHAVGAQSIYLARRDRHHAIAIDTAIKGHVQGCPLAKEPKLPGILGYLFPFRWCIVAILCVWAISPYVGPSLGKLVDKETATILVEKASKIHE